MQPSAHIIDRVIYPSSYPQFRSSGGTDEDLQKILDAVYLGYLPAREGGLDTRKEWKDVLSVSQISS